MQHLLELKYGYDMISDLLSLPPGKGEADSLLDRFFYLIIKGTVTTDEEVAILLYGKGKDGSYAPYQKLKAKLKVYFPYRVCQLILPEGGALTTIFNTRMCLLWAKECKSRLKVMAAEWLLLEAFERAKEVEQFRIAREAAEELCGLYVGALYDPEKFQHFRKAVEHFSKIEEVVGILHTHYYTMKGMEIKKDRRLQTHGNDFQPIFNETSALLQQYNGSKVVNYGYGILQSILLINGNFSIARKYAEEALEKTKELTYMKQGLLAIRISTLTLILSKLGKHKECLDLINQREQIGLSQSTSPYVYRFYRIVSLLALERYEESVFESGRIELLQVEKLHSTEYAASFRVIFAYQHIISKLDVIPNIDLPKQVANFRLSRFMNQVQVFEKNKQGYNIHLRIIELIYLVINKKYDTFIDKTEGVEKYVVRYLSKPDHQRNGLFLKMLASAAKHNFDAEIIEREEQDNFKELKSLDNVAFLMDLPSTEFISYDKLWLLFLAALKE